VPPAGERSPISTAPAHRAQVLRGWSVYPGMSDLTPACPSLRRDRAVADGTRFLGLAPGWAGAWGRGLRVRGPAPGRGKRRDRWSSRTGPAAPHSGLHLRHPCGRVRFDDRIVARVLDLGRPPCRGPSKRPAPSPAAGSDETAATFSALVSLLRGFVPGPGCEGSGGLCDLVSAGFWGRGRSS